MYDIIVINYKYIYIYWVLILYILFLFLNFFGRISEIVHKDLGVCI